MENLYRHMYEGIIPWNNRIIIQKLETFLSEGGDINSVFPQRFRNSNCLGTILHYFVDLFSFWDCGEVLEFILSKGANIAIELTSEEDFVEHPFVLDIAAERYKISVFEMLKKRGLEQYSSYNLTPLHFDCALLSDVLSVEQTILQHLKTTDVNAAISAESPIWPGMTPLLIAAKFQTEQVVTSLLDHGADPFARELEGRNPIHYLDPINQFYDERLFDFNKKNTFCSLTGLSHFHIACRFCQYGALNIVKRYLDQGFSPDSRAKTGEHNSFYARKVGLHIAMETEHPELARLLLEHGADANKKSLKGRTPLEDFIDWLAYVNDYKAFVKCICLLIEAGSNVEEVDMKELHELISVDSTVKARRIFLKCITKLTTLNEHLVPKKLMDVYLDCAKKPQDGWNEAKYTGRCYKELKVLFDLGLRRLMDGSIITVMSDFKSKFEWLESFDYGSYPIYGSLLKMSYKRKLREFESKKRKIPSGLAQVQELFRSLGHLPQVCAHMIIWNLSDEELTLFMKQIKQGHFIPEATHA